MVHSCVIAVRRVWVMGGGARNSQDQFVAAARKINCDYTLRGISHFTRRGHLKVASGRERRECVMMSLLLCVFLFLCYKSS